MCWVMCPTEFGILFNISVEYEIIEQTSFLAQIQRHWPGKTMAESVLGVSKLSHLVTFINYGIPFAILPFQWRLKLQGRCGGNWIEHYGSVWNCNEQKKCCSYILQTTLQKCEKRQQVDRQNQLNKWIAKTRYDIIICLRTSSANTCSVIHISVL